MRKSIVNLRTRNGFVFHSYLQYALVVSSGDNSGAAMFIQHPNETIHLFASNEWLRWCFSPATWNNRLKAEWTSVMRSTNKHTQTAKDHSKRQRGLLSAESALGLYLHTTTYWTKKGVWEKSS